MISAKSIYKFMFILCGIATTVHPGYSYEEDDKDIHFVVVPGQNGCGGEEAISNNIINPYDDNYVVKAKTPEEMERIDLGQKNCIDDFIETLEENNLFDKNIVIHATSQGTATILNWLGKYPPCTNVKAVILEAVLESGNSAIKHTISGPFSPVPYAASSIPESSLGYSAKIAIFPAYSPSGMQALKSVESIPTNIPIIIIHSKDDSQLPYDGAFRIYSLLREYGNDNVYFFSKEGSVHLNILSLYYDKEKINAINAIFAYHNLPHNRELAKNYTDTNGSDFSQYQPEPSLPKESWILAPLEKVRNWLNSSSK
jgi:hypothetical protein